MTDHETYRELAALSVYGELESDETAVLASHLASCAPCAALVRDLRAGLGRLASGPQTDDLPAGWRAGLDRELAPRPARRAGTLPVWVAAAASFLAGASLAWSLSAPASAPAGALQPVASMGRDGGPSAGFVRSTPPPRARDRSSLPLLELYLRR